MIPMIIRVLFVFAFCFASALAQEIEVKGAVTNPLKVTPEVLAKMPRAAVSATIHGVTNKFEGVWLHDVLKQAGVPSGKNLKGKALTSCLLVK
ncbi:MAG TPA: hypothetical protein VE621_08475, partial [Bryobacteraceae bacterium]|nr:hypothetical protein [Bryobacteraceae bacterium]